MATTVKRLTFEDLDAIPEEHEGDRHELIDGELVVTPVPVPEHQIVLMNLVRALDQHANAGNLGLVLPAPTGIRFTPDNLLVPDIIFIARDRLHVIGPRTVDAAPDLVVEILSPGTRQRDLTVKRALYARFGVQEYWIVDPAARTVTVLALAGDHFEPVPHAEDGAIVSRVLPGIELALDDVYPGIAESR